MNSLHRTAYTDAQIADIRKEQAAKIAMLHEAASIQLESYRRLINSGDAGNWDCEKEPEVIALVAALSATEQDVAKFIAEIEARGAENAAADLRNVSGYKEGVRVEMQAWINQWAAEKRAK